MKSKTGPRVVMAVVVVAVAIRAVANRDQLDAAVVESWERGSGP